MTAIVGCAAPFNPPSAEAVPEVKKNRPFCAGRVRRTRSYSAGNDAFCEFKLSYAIPSLLPSQK